MHTVDHQRRCIGRRRGAGSRREAADQASEGARSCCWQRGGGRSVLAAADRPHGCRRAPAPDNVSLKLKLLLVILYKETMHAERATLSPLKPEDERRVGGVLAPLHKRVEQLPAGRLVDRQIPAEGGAKFHGVARPKTAMPGCWLHVRRPPEPAAACIRGWGGRGGARRRSAAAGGRVPCAARRRYQRDTSSDPCQTELVAHGTQHVAAHPA